MQFQTKVAGIPCQCRVLAYSPGSPMRITGSGFGDAEPPEHEEFDFEILDRKGYKASWLKKKLTPEDEARLLEEYNLECLGERLGYIQ